MSKVAAPSRSDWRITLGVPIGTWFMRLLGLTWRFKVHNFEVIERLEAEKRGYIIALWHGQLFPLAFYMRDRGIVVLVSGSRDGEIIARVNARFGYRGIRGSSSKGGREALIEMIAALKQGDAVAVTPDGPRGPPLKFQPGALIASMRAQAPIVPYVMKADRVWRFKSWDGFQVPKPFARVTIVFGEPTVVRGESAADAIADAPRIESLLHAAQELADA